MKERGSVRQSGSFVSHWVSARWRLDKRGEERTEESRGKLVKTHIYKTNSAAQTHTTTKQKLPESSHRPLRRKREK